MREEGGVRSGPATAPERMISGPFLVVTATAFLFFVYVGTLVPTLPKLIEDRLGGTEFDIGLNLAAFSVAAIAARPALGRFGERHGLRWMMTCGALLASASTAVMAVVMNRWALLPLRALQGIGEATVFVGGATMINDFAPAHRRAEAASYFSVAVFGGLGIGPVIGETVTGHDHFARAMLVAASFVAASAVLSRFAPPGRVSAATAGEVAGSDVKFHPAAFRPGAVLALGVAGFATFNAFMPVYAGDVGLNGSKWVFTTYSVLCLLIRLAAAKVPERIGLARAASLALLSLATGLLVFVIVPTRAGVFGGVVFLAIGMSFLYPAVMAVAVNAVPERDRVRVISTFTMFFEVGSAAGGIAFGALAELTAKRGAFAGGAVSSLIGVWVLWRVLVPWVAANRAPLASATVMSESR